MVDVSGSQKLDRWIDAAAGRAMRSLRCKGRSGDSPMGFSGDEGARRGLGKASAAFQIEAAGIHEAPDCVAMRRADS